MTEKQDPIQAQLIEARCNQILDAATQVFAAKGFHRATIRDVAKAAGIADGTIYNYFDNKTGLILGILDRLNETQQRAGAFEQAQSGDLSMWVRDYIKQRYTTLEGQGLELFQVLIPELLVNQELRDLYLQQVVKPTFALAEQAFQQWQTEGAIKPGDAPLMMRVITGATLGLILLRLLGDEVLESQWAQLPDVVAEMFLRGLLPGENHEPIAKDQYHQSSL